MAIDAISQRSRRALLTGAVGGAAALVAQAIGRPLPVSAVDPPYVVLGGTNSTSGTTLISSTASDQCVWSTAVSGIGVLGTSGSSIGAYGSSSLGVGVRGESHSGIAIQGIAYGASQTSIHGIKSVGGVAVHGEITNANSGWTAVYGSTSGSGVGVVGENTNTGAGTWGKANGTGDGIYGESANGYGGHFKGKKAQLKLDPSGAATHPSSGLAGDIFLDKSKRLWLCKGGTSWVRIV